MLSNVSAMHGGKERCNTGARSDRLFSPAPGHSWIMWSSRRSLDRLPLLSGLAQFYYVMAGDGTVSLSTRGQQDTAAIRKGDAVPIQMGEIHSFENTGTQPLELMVVGVARDLRKELDFVDASPAAPRRN